jgi:hypothetical protein
MPADGATVCIDVRDAAPRRAVRPSTPRAPALKRDAEIPGFAVDPKPGFWRGTLEGIAAGWWGRRPWCCPPAPQ